jgi:vitamin B12 transporter
MKGQQVPYMVQVAAGVINITLKQESNGTAYNIGTQTTADRTYRPEDYNQGLSVNGNLDKFNYYACTETTGISEAVYCTSCYESDRFPNKFIDQTGFYANEKLSLDFCELR